MNAKPQNVTTDTNRPLAAEPTVARNDLGGENSGRQPNCANQILIVVNGHPLTMASGSTVSDVLQQQGVRTDLVAVEVNMEIVAKHAHNQTVLNEGDQIEVVTLVGGG